MTAPWAFSTSPHGTTGAARAGHEQCTVCNRPHEARLVRFIPIRSQTTIAPIPAEKGIRSVKDYPPAVPVLSPAGRGLFGVSARWSLAVA
ncbi:MAG TPA: hypothetical protein VGV64_03245 [Thermoplasmata archaeon]|nr:hypothetical protein [Thermoplasmata archaeon]